MDRVIGYATRGISKGIAVTSEVVVGSRRKSSDAGCRASDPIENRRDSRPEDEDEDYIEAEWELDDAAQQSEILPSDLAPIVSSDVEDVIKQLAFRADTTATQLTPMPQTVIIPQRRPRDRSRGFIRAYAPILGTHAGIDQATFLTFLNDFDRAAKASPIFDVINIACFGIGMVPSTVCIVVSTVVGTAASVAKEVQIRYRSNRFLDQANKHLFMPRGVYAMVMTYKPELSDEAILEADTSDSTSLAVYKSLNGESSLFKRGILRLKSSSGAVKGDNQMPEPAPLIYPSLDLVLQSQAQTQSSSKELSKTPSGPLALLNNAAVQDYLDRRAQAEFIHKNPNTKLADTLPPVEKQYVNRFADPNHPVNSGSIFGLLSGGTFDPIANGRIRRAERRARKNGEPNLTTEERHEAYMGRKVRGRTTGTPSKQMSIMGKMLKKDVLYLCIVKLPTEEEIDSVRAILESSA